MKMLFWVREWFNEYECGCFSAFVCKDQLPDECPTHHSPVKHIFSVQAKTILPDNLPNEVAEDLTLREALE